jgi:hypothetical protein
MILPDFVIPSRVDQHWKESGIDSLEFCKNKKHFQNYTHLVHYDYNSRGYRDQEWSESIEQLTQAIWCVGDSFTVGIGCPWAHTWPYILQQHTQTRTINVSMDGASNEWIARKCQRILQEIQPQFLIIQWSYICRREKDITADLINSWHEFYNNIKDADWPTCEWHSRNQLPEAIKDEIQQLHGGWQEPNFPDEDLRVWYSKCDLQQDAENLLSCVRAVEQATVSTKIIHSFIPGFALNLDADGILSQIQGCVIPQIQILDLARDYHHYDIKTSQAFVQQVTNFLK